MRLLLRWHHGCSLKGHREAHESRRR